MYSTYHYQSSCPTRNTAFECGIVVGLLFFFCEDLHGRINVLIGERFDF